MGLRNYNVEWLDGRGTWWFYLGAIFCSRYFWFLVGAGDEMAWTMVICCHAVVTIWLLHFKKGSLLTWDDNAGKFDDMTYWEQIDQGVLNTSNRKFLIICPLVLLLIGYRATTGTLLMVNLVFSLLALVPKIPLFGALWAPKRRTLTRPSSYTELFHQSGFHSFRSSWDGGSSGDVPPGDSGELSDSETEAALEPEMAEEVEADSSSAPGSRGHAKKLL
eukprot:CAMPEP_0180138212 /NCGR_PEP_ID=MMETSP0986-20121125/12729_1 /TAXON_ID=697907 /ORGANISM="non described non described, Strain CCMP2293" /LENGTH=218 /DNA_ID=CAMNT_0022079933 /DNA_START=210 /DNA_END=866 /DNA_ORIENTATION=-